jgi:hypothetical protein
LSRRSRGASTSPTTPAPCEESEVPMPLRERPWRAIEPYRPTSSERPLRRVESPRLSRGSLMSTQRGNRDEPLRGRARCRCEGPHTDSGHRGAASTRSPILTRHCSYPYGVDHIEAAAWHDAGRARHHLVERLSRTYRQSATAPLWRVTDLFK